jgi:CRISPR-associated endonuclease/helicase Cas3
VADQPSPPLNAAKRLELLDQYVAELGRLRHDERSRLRSLVYRQCRDADCSAGLLECDSPVGSGKTTAVMSHLLKAGAAKGLRRVFVVLPFTNIIDQSVEVYRKSVVMTNEAEDEVVVAHHHKAEFDEPAARQYSFLWHAPIVVTTAVQFFETLAARNPASLRKLHQLPGSAIFIDEAHAALPVHLWPQAWLWLRELERDWNCHIVLGSGSLQRFWEHEEFVTPPVKVPQVIMTDVRESSADHERRRVKYRSRSESLGLEGLAEFVKNVEGPRLLIVNTVQSAAALARDLAKRFGGEHVEHLSTALTPRDRKATLELVKLRLRQPNHRDWTLVATSCVEAGVDFSFRTGIRERCSLTSLLQIAGRVNRSDEYERADVWDIQLRHDYLLRPHPAFEASARILAELFDEDRVSPDFCTEALRREITQGGMAKTKESILIAERNADFPEVEKLFRVISSNTLTAVVDKEIIGRLEGGEKLSRDEFQGASVQIWQDRAHNWGVAEFDYIPGLFKWVLEYDSFLGYMAGVLPLIDHGEAGSII